MKKLILLLCFLLAVSGVFSQDNAIEEINDFIEEQNTYFKDPKKSPLLKEDLKQFKELAYYPVDLSFRVTATFVRTHGEQPFAMETSTNRRPIYVKYGELHFELQGKKLQLNVYQSQNLVFEEEYKDYLFLPFTDATSGDTTYGGGRYIDMRIPEGETVVLDFNQSYNPYCAYGGSYSCPIPPAENNLDIAITAGVKKFKDH